MHYHAWPCVFWFDRGSGVSRKINFFSAVPLKFTNGKLLGTKLVATYDTPIHEDLSLIYYLYLFHTLYSTFLLSGIYQPTIFSFKLPFYSCGLEFVPYRLGKSVRLRIGENLLCFLM